MAVGGTTKSPKRAARTKSADQRLSRDEIVAVARRLLAEGGVERLTMRRLADACGVQGPALYWHFTDKDELLGRIVESVVGDLESGNPGQPWDERLVASGRSLRRLLVAHPGLANVAAGRYTLTDAVLDGIEELVGVLVGAGFTHREALIIYFSVITLTTGFVIFETSSPFFGLAATAPGSADRRERLERYAPLDDLVRPHIAVAIGALPDLTVDELFEESLRAHVAGWATRLAAA